MPSRLFSGVQPSGRLHLGNYLGAIKQWIALQDEYEALFCVVDLHAITIPQDPRILKEKTFEIAKTYLALGIDPDRSHIFVQSHVKEHTELAWILNTITKNGDLTKMTQFKSKSGFTFEKTDILEKEIIEIQKQKQIILFGSSNKRYLDELSELEKSLGEKISQLGVEYIIAKESFNDSTVGLFDYPVLMASDILLYDTDIVPVGEDQTQHLELTRTLARRFNKQFGDTFRVPKTRVMEEGARIMGLDDPTKKMSKSASSEYNYIAFDDDMETAKKKIMKAVTDSGSDITYEEARPALKNLITLYASLSSQTPEQIVEKYQGKGYADFKRDLADTVGEFLETFQEAYEAISDDDVRDVLKKGAEYARSRAKEKMRQVRNAVGFLW